MTLPYSPSRAVYAGNGTATVFPFAFKVWSEEQLVVSLTSPEGVTSVAQGWSAALNESGGAVTYLHKGAPLPEGWRLAIVRDMPFGQDIDLVSATRFDAQVIEDGLDQACAERQELRERLARAVVVPVTSDETPEELVQSVYESRDAAASSASDASDSADAAAASALLAQAWAESDTAPNAADAGSKSAKTWAGLAAGSADNAAASESNAADSADLAQAWAESPTPPDPDDPDSKSAREWALIASDSVPIATPTLAGKVKPDGASIEVAQDGTISVPAATATDRGIARLATQAEVQAGAAASGSLTPAVLRVDDIQLAGPLLMYNTRTVLTTSGSWTAPVTGWYHYQLRGGGGGGGGGYIVSSYGFGGGGGAGGEILDGYLYLTAGTTVTYTIGAGGAGGAASADGSAGGNTTLTVGTATYTAQGGGGGGRSGFGGASSGNSLLYPSMAGSNGQLTNNTGTGAIGGTGGGYGGGNGLTKTSSAKINPSGVGAGGGGGFMITNNVQKGDDGYQGAIIIEYFDPNAAAA